MVASSLFVNIALWSLIYNTQKKIYIGKIVTDNFNFSFAYVINTLYNLYYDY